MSSLVNMHPPRTVFTANGSVHTPSTTTVRTFSSVIVQTPVILSVHIAAATDSVHHDWTLHRYSTTNVSDCSTFTVQTSVFSVHVAAATYNAHRTFPLSIVWTVSAFTVKRPPSSLLTQLCTSSTIVVRTSSTFTVHVHTSTTSGISHTSFLNTSWRVSHKRFKTQLQNSCWKFRSSAAYKRQPKHALSRIQVINSLLFLFLWYSPCLSGLPHVYTPSRQIRPSSDSITTHTPHVKTKTSGHRSFPYAAPSFWNSPPRDVELAV